MKEFNYFILLFLTLASCNRKPTEQQITGKIDTLAVTDLTKDEIKYPDSMFNKSYTLKSGERFLRLEIVMNVSLDSVWHSFSSEEGIKTWMAPVSQLDFKIEGEKPSAKIIPYYLRSHELILTIC